MEERHKLLKVNQLLYSVEEVFMFIHLFTYAQYSTLNIVIIEAFSSYFCLLSTRRKDTRCFVVCLDSNFREKESVGLFR
jgi:hypothetical protein